MPLPTHLADQSNPPHRCRPVAYNEADFHLVEQLPDGSTNHFAVFQQQAARYLPQEGRSALARAKLLTPYNPSFREQPAAAEVDGFVVYLYRKCAVGAAHNLKHMLDARDSGIAVGASSANVCLSASDSDDEDVLEEQCGLLLGLDLVAERVEAEQQAALDADQEADFEPEDTQEARASAAQAEQQQQQQQQQLRAGEANSSGAAAPAPDAAEAVPGRYRYSELVAAEAVVDCAEPAEVVVAFLQLLLDRMVG